MEKYQTIKNKLSTGDLILFHGPGPESELIEVIDHTQYSHVAMVVKLPNHEKPLLWTSDEITSITDELNNQRHKGVHLLDLADVLKFCHNKVSKSGKHYTFTWRQLDYQKPENFMNKLEKFLQHVDGTAFPSIEAMAFHFFEGRLGISSGTKSMFCSELVTDTYVHLDLLPADTIINSLSPGSYAQGQGLKLLNGAKLSVEIPFKFE
jgi:hypothetical protein